MSDTAHLIIDIFILIFASFGSLTSIGVLLLIFYHRHRSPINTSIFLICNSYLSIIYVCFFLLNTYSYNLYGDLHLDISLDSWWCYLRGYFLHVGLGALYHSYLLQTLFRFFRVVFFKQKQLQTIRFMSLLVLIQWLMDFLFILPSLLLQHFQYISGYYFCQLSYTCLKCLVPPAIVTYYIPMTGIGFIYFYIIYYMKKTNNQSMIQNRQRANQRDLVVIRRIIILVGMLFILSFPSLIIWMMYVINGYLYPLIYHLQWLTYTFSLSILPVVSVLLTPQLRELFTVRWRQNQHIRPPMKLHSNRNNQTTECSDIL